MPLSHFYDIANNVKQQFERQLNEKHFRHYYIHVNGDDRTISYTIVEHDGSTGEYVIQY